MVYLILGSGPWICQADAAEAALSVNGYCLPGIQIRTVDGNLLFPVFETLQPLGYTVSNVSATGQVEIRHRRRGLTVVISPGSAAAEVNGTEISVSTAMYFYQGAFWAPLDFLEKAFGFSVDSGAGGVYVLTQPPEIMAALSEVDALCGRETLEFLLSLYELESGGFYYCPSARDHVQFGTNLESTNQALSFLQTGGTAGLDGNIRDLIPTQAQNRLINTVLQAQDPEDGYFYNSWQGKQVGQAKRERDLSAATAILNRFGVDPLYPLPAERLSSVVVLAADESAARAGINDYLSSKDHFLSWLDSQNWDDPYQTGHLIASSAETIQAAGLLDVACDYLTSRQNQETGLWGEGYTYDATNAAMKMGAVYARAMRPYPNMEKAVDSVIRTITGPDQPETICEVWNPLEAIHYMYTSCDFQVADSVKAMLRENLLTLIQVTKGNMQLFRKPDGGVSYYKGFGQEQTHGSPAGLGLAEGDVDATYIGTLQIRRTLYQLADFSFMPPLYEAYGTLVTETMSEKPAQTTEPNVLDIQFYREDGTAVTEMEAGMIQPVCRMKGKAEQQIWVLTALYGQDILLDIEKTAVTLNGKVQDIKAPAMKAEAGQMIKVFAVTQGLAPCGSPGILNDKSGEKDIYGGTAVVGGRSFPVYSDPHAKTLTVYLPLEPDVKEGMTRCEITLQGTGRIVPAQIGTEQNLVNRSVTYRVTAENGSYDTYTLSAVMTQVQRAYNFNGAKVLETSHSVPQRRGAFGYLSGSGNQGYGMWYNLGFAFDQTGAPIPEQSFGTISLSAAGRDEECGVLEKTAKGGELGIISLGGDAELAGSSYRYLCRFAFCIDYAEPGAVLRFGSGNEQQFYIRAAEDGEIAELTCTAAPDMINRIEQGVWYEIAYVWDKAADGCRMTWYLNGRFAGIGKLSTQDSGSLRSTDTVQGKPPYQFSLSIESDALAKVRLDDFYLSAARDTL